MLLLSAMSTEPFPVVPSRSEPETGTTTRRVESIDAGQWNALVAWLDGGLRRGIAGRLAAEYPASLRPELAASHRVVRDGERWLAHAMLHRVDLRLPEPLTIGLVGLVYTDPAARGHGYASACVSACTAELERQGVPLVLLFSDQPDFYARLGFEPLGSERAWAVDASLCQHARRAPGLASPGTITVDAPRRQDWRRLEKLYAKKKVHAVRAPGALEQLAAAPDTELVVARIGGRAVGYAALGRGDDLQGVVHEWAGGSAEILACLERLCGEHGVLRVHGCPEETRLGIALERAGAMRSESPLGLGRVLRPGFVAPRSLYLWGFDSV